MFYRNQTSTMDQIKMIGTMRITNTQEAVAFLRAVQPINEQVAAVLQRVGLSEQHAVNRVVAPTPEPQPEPAIVPEEPKNFVPADLGTDDSFSEKEIEEKVAKLKSARKKKED